MLKLALCGVALALAPAPAVMPVTPPVSAARPAAGDPPERLHHPPRPPARFLKDGAVALIGLADEATVHRLCGGEADGSPRVLACVVRRPDGAAVMLMPNPCRYEGYYAELACHEQGHVNGWGPEHGG